jgi:hypothetical protein
MARTKKESAASDGSRPRRKMIDDDDRRFVTASRCLINSGCAVIDSFDGGGHVQTVVH